MAVIYSKIISGLMEAGYPEEECKKYISQKHHSFSEVTPARKLDKVIDEILGNQKGVVLDI